MRRRLILLVICAVLAQLLPLALPAVPVVAADAPQSWNITPIVQGLDGQSFVPGDVNSNGQVVGTLRDSGGFSHPAVWKAGTLTMLPTPDGYGSAASINEAGYVAGDDYSNSVPAH